MITTGFHLDFNPVIWPTVSAAVLQQAAKYDIGLLAFQNEVMTVPGQMTGAQVPQDWAPMDAQIAAFRALNPTMRLGIHAGNTSFTYPWEPAASWVSANDVYLLWANGLPLLTDSDGVRKRVINTLDPGIRRWLVGHYREFCAAHDLDMILLDTFSPPYLASLLATPPPGGWFGLGSAAGSYGDPLVWAPAFAAYGEALRWGLESDGRTVMLNGVGLGGLTGGVISGWFGLGQSNIADYGSSVMYEHFHQSYGTLDDFRSVINIVKGVVAKRRHVFCSTQPRLVGPGDPRYALSTDPAFERFFFATYLLIASPPYTSYGYHPYSPYLPINDANQPYVHWSTDWEWDLGLPLGDVYETPAGLFARDYEKALVLVNPTDAYTQIGLGLTRWRIWEPAGGVFDMAPAAPGYLFNVAPKSSVLLWRAP